MDGHGSHKAVCEDSIVTKISDIQLTYHTAPILMVINLTGSHVDYINLCMMSKLVSTFSIHHAQYTVLRFDKELHSDSYDLGLVIMLVALRWLTQNTLLRYGRVSNPVLIALYVIALDESLSEPHQSCW